MAWDVMIFMQAKSIIRTIGRGGPRKSRLFWALKWYMSCFCVLYFVFVVYVVSFMYRRPTLYPLEIAVDFLKSL